MEDARSDAEILAQVRVHPEEFANIFHRHYDTIHGYLARRIGPDVADDLASEVFLVALRRAAAFDGRDREALPWLYGIATNVLHRHRRDEVRRWRAFQRLAGREDAYVDVEFDAVEDRQAAAQFRSCLAAALSEMGRHRRDVLLLHAWEGLTYEQIAHALGVPVGTVRSRLWRARRMVRELCEPTGQQTGDGHLPIDRGGSQ